MQKKYLKLRRDLLTWLITKKTNVKNQLKTFYQKLEALVQKYGWRTLVIVFFGALFYQKDVQVQFGMDNAPLASLAALATPKAVQSTETFAYAEASTDIQEAKAMVVKEEITLAPTSVAKGFWSKKATPAPAPTPAPKVEPTNWNDDGTLANTYSNLIYTNPKFATKNTTRAEKIKLDKQIAYIKRFAEVARTEMEKFGIPASITLAQGLLESNVGESRLAKNNNNHFGVKCFSRSCGKGHCSNFTDDSHKDFFRKYNSAWESYRAHSRMLGGNRYKSLKKLGTKDYKNWAKGLKKAGYATDKRYAEKLINLIEDLELYRFDN